jgi:tripartite-type tricarboxylate transporter receptor subunit TctC
MRVASLSRRALLGAGAAGLAGAATAQQPGAWPDRPVRLINSGAAGSGIDLLARLLAEGLSPALGQPFVVENRPGAGSVLAAGAHAAARPGESLLLGATGIASTVPHTFTGRLPYDPAGLEPVAIAGSEFLCLVVPAETGPATLRELVQRIANQPGGLNWYSVPGFVELSLRLFLHEQRLDANYVAYQGSPAAATDLLAGRIQFAMLPLTPILPMAQDGRLRILAVTASQRAPFLRDTPTMTEAGFPALRYDAFTALFGWRGMEEATRIRLSALVSAVLSRPEASARLARAGIAARYGEAAELASVIADQRDIVLRAGRMMRTAG